MVQHQTLKGLLEATPYLALLHLLAAVAAQAQLAQTELQLLLVMEVTELPHLFLVRL